MPYYLVNSVQVIVILIIMIIMNPLLTLLTVVTVPFIMISMKFLFERMDKFHAKRWTRSRQMNSILSDILSGMRVVKAFSKEKEETTRFDRSSATSPKSSRKPRYSEQSRSLPSDFSFT